MMKRYGALVGNPDANTDATTYKNDRNVDLADYGVIYEEAAPWSSCTQAAADALTLRTYNGNYLSAAHGGGSSVNAVPTSPGTYEQFSLMNRTDTKQKERSFS